MRNVTKELAKAMLEKRSAIASNKDTTEIDIKINALRDFKTKVTEFQTSGSKKKYDAAAELSILKSMIKQRKNSIEEYKKASRNDLIFKEDMEIQTLEKLLPELPDEATIGSTYLEWRQEVKSEVEFPYISKKEMGKAIKDISEKFELVDKALVSKIVKTHIKE